MLQGKGSVDSRCAVSAAVAPELASTFAAIKSPADIPEAEPPTETMVGSGACLQPATAWRIATAGVLTFPSTLLLSGGLFYLLS
jgi:hypothetical protein